MSHFKIVRDNVDAWASKHGVSGVWRPCADPIPALRKKLLEEIGEYMEFGDNVELYDIRDVLDRLIRIVDPFGVGRDEHEAKVERMGLFENLVEWSPVPAENEGEVIR